MNSENAPKAFISYSWTSHEHETWVMDLAKELEESGVHVVIDKWELREGADKYAFMEKMVTDKDIRKVIIISDKTYSEKADGRKGGVGTETQIISQEVYDQVDPTDQEQKFVAIIAEKEENGKPYIPTFLKSRIYIDMSDSESKVKNFEQLVRWIFDKPLYQRPERGATPRYVTEENLTDLGVQGVLKRLKSRLREGHSSAYGMMDEFVDIFSENFERLRIEPKDGIEYDEQVFQSIHEFLPYRDDLTELFLIIGRYGNSPELFESLHSLFEKLLPYRMQPIDSRTWQREWADNFCFITQELFLYCIASLIKTNEFDGAAVLLDREYYLEPGHQEFYEGGLVPFILFKTYLYSIEARNKRLKKKSIHLIADIFKERGYRRDVTFNDLMQADFIVWLRAELICMNSEWKRWYPDTLLYASRMYKPFELFSRAKSKAYFAKLLPLLGIGSKEDYLPLFEKYKAGQMQLPKYNYETIDPTKFMNYDNLATSD